MELLLSLLLASADVPPAAPAPPATVRRVQICTPQGCQWVEVPAAVQSPQANSPGIPDSSSTIQAPPAVQGCATCSPQARPTFRLFRRR